MARRFLLLALFFAAWPASALAQSGPKNVLLLIADDLGRDLGCYGDKVARTPNLDKLAKSGTLFTRAYATTASCSPSRSTIYSGLFTHQNGIYGLQHSAHNFHSFPWVQGVPNLLRAAGYWTGIIAKIHVGPRSVYDFEVENSKGGGRNPAQLAKSTRDFLGQRGKRPFFLVVASNDPHRAAVGFGNEPFQKDPAEVKFNPKDVPVPPFLPDRPEVRQDLAEYYEAAERFDRSVGLILEALRESGEFDNTLIIVTSDNGIPFPGAKTTLYESGVHLPFIVSCPGHRDGRQTSGLVSFVDTVPTVLDWTGAKGPSYKLPGRSFLPLVRDPSAKGQDAVFGSHQLHEITMYYPMRSITTERYQMIINLDYKKDFPLPSDLWASPTWQVIRKEGIRMMGERSTDAFLHRPKEELFDLSKDPNNAHNLAGDPGHAEILAGLRRRIRQFQADTNDPWQILYRDEDPAFNKK